MPTTSTAKRLTADERRNQLIDTAMRLFSRNGFNGTTTREIALAAGVNEAIIFRFFPHKDDLYAAILERKASQSCTDAWVEELQTAAAAGDDEAVIRIVVRHLIEHHRRDPIFALDDEMRVRCGRHGIASVARRMAGAARAT